MEQKREWLIVVQRGRNPLRREHLGPFTLAERERRTEDLIRHRGHTDIAFWSKRVGA